MKQYELLCVLRGTLSEEEVGSVIASVKEMIQKFEGEVINHKDMGKRRIAYPIKHIRYGYFHLVHFDAMPEQVPGIQGKLRIMSELLRGIVSVRSRGDIALGDDVTIGNVIDEIVPRQKTREKSDRPDKKEKKISTKEKTESTDVVKEPAVAEGSGVTKESASAKSSGVTKEPAAAKSSGVTKKVKAKKEEKKISMEDIDKQLDDILQSDLEKV